VIAPIHQGQRLTRRSALKDVLSSELPRSTAARIPARRALRGALIGGKRAARDALDRRDQHAAYAFVAEVGQCGVLLLRLSRSSPPRRCVIPDLFVVRCRERAQSGATRRRDQRAPNIKVKVAAWLPNLSM
jgi:hypothetical protein